MLRTEKADGKVGRGRQAVAVVMDRLVAGTGQPDLTLLAQAVVGARPCLAGVRRLAVAIDPDRAFLLDGSWSRRKDVCLVAGDDAAPRWVALPGGWNPLAACASRRNEPVVCGRAPLPGGAPWPVEPDAEAGPWCLLPIRVLGHAVACVIAEVTDEAALPDVTAELTDLGRTLDVVTGLWAELVAVGAELDQARNERDSLTRLNRLQGRFVAMTSHEFKTPLTSITAYTDVLRTQLTDEHFPHACEFLDVIKAEADRLLRMVNRILDFTRVEYGSRLLTRVPTELMPLVRETVRGLQAVIQAKDLNVAITATGDVPRAVVDADLIRQVLVNLIGNAVKFTPREGSITVTVFELESAVAVSVADDGPGIPAEDIRRIFREYYRAEGETTREEGTGLGLTIARHIVQLHGGHIEARRSPSGGAEFRFMVPKETDSAAEFPLDLGPKANPAEVRTLVDELLRLVGELTGSRAVMILLRDNRGALVPVGQMGCEVEAVALRPLIEGAAWGRFLQAGLAEVDPAPMAGDLAWAEEASGRAGRMFAPLGAGESAVGVVVAGRRRREGAYTPADLAQLTILADVIRAALQGVPMNAGRAIEAVRLLLTIRRSGVPTSTSQALDLLAKLARRLGIGSQGTRRIQYAATLHDAGMARVEEEIVYGGAKLNVDERDEVERHVEQGMDLMAPLLPDEATAVIIRHHHERFDGAGYPDGLAGEAIPLGSRLLAVIDAWFSLTRTRSFRQGLDPAPAMAEILSHVGTQFDPRVVREFQAVLADEGILAATVPEPGRQVP